MFEILNNGLVKRICDRCYDEKIFTKRYSNDFLKEKSKNEFHYCSSCGMITSENYKPNRKVYMECDICKRNSNQSRITYNQKYQKYLCPKHYGQIEKYGYFLDNIQRTINDRNEIIVLENYAEILLYDNYGEECERAIIDIEDIEKVKIYKWALTKRGYVVSHSRKGTRINLHNLVMDFTYKKEIDLEVDHINRIKIDNRKRNLRFCTHQKNTWNQSEKSNKKIKNLGVGVIWNVKNQCYVAGISINGKHIYLGSSRNFDDALALRIEAEKLYYGQYAPNQANINCS